jgi:hypothetical protein
LEVQILNGIFALEHDGNLGPALASQNPKLSIRPNFGLEKNPRTFLSDGGENGCKAQEGDEDNSRELCHV